MRRLQPSIAAVRPSLQIMPRRQSSSCPVVPQSPASRRTARPAYGVRRRRSPALQLSPSATHAKPL
ncbi:hypothetical protein PsYK624_154180 [Phanerochaete sordida]|uniref:Uncharacterized protein n=1 Tax=Phanerochaete sordida TaxID=48140 RepID=A0A9P3GQ84_9APHY|nr:hypothetical protein PsYK624_154180 [Phanerochaete sordida]